MVNQVLSLFVLVAVATCHYIQPRDLVDEANAQLVQLQSIVQGDTLAAHTELGNYLSDFGVFGRNTLQEGIVSVQLEHETSMTQLQELKDLAQAAHADITVCTNVREDVLHRLPQGIASEMTDCIEGLGQESSRLTNSARNRIDNTMNKVHQLQYQFQRCDGNLLCISPILTEIELDKIRLPQTIKTETLATLTLLNSLKINVQDCSTSKLAQYATEANILLTDIATCVNRILG